MISFFYYKKYGIAKSIKVIFIGAFAFINILPIASAQTGTKYRSIISLETGLFFGEVPSPINCSDFDDHIADLNFPIDNVEEEFLTIVRNSNPDLWPTSFSGHSRYGAGTLDGGLSPATYNGITFNPNSEICADDSCSSEFENARYVTRSGRWEWESTVNSGTDFIFMRTKVLSSSCEAIDIETRCGGSDSGLGNPCNPGTGNKYQREVDLKTEFHSLGITRNYHSNSKPEEATGFGVGWHSPLFHRLQIETEFTGDFLIVKRGSGKGELWENVGGVWVRGWDSKYSIVSTSNGYSISDTTGKVEVYDDVGKPLSETSATGLTKTYSYNGSGQLISITNHFGHSLNLTWNNLGYVDTITDHHGGNYQYSYDANDNLIQVTYPDSATKTYHYENSAFPNHLTGVTDENGSRFSTFTYDDEGRPISTEHAVTENGDAQEKYQVDYGQE